MKLMGKPAKNSKKPGKSRNRDRSTSLWMLIEGMQRRLEAEGLENNVVDVAVTEGLRTLLSEPANNAVRNGREQTRLSSLFAMATPLTS